MCYVLPLGVHIEGPVFSVYFDAIHNPLIRGYKLVITILLSFLLHLLVEYFYKEEILINSLVTLGYI